MKKAYYPKAGAKMQIDANLLGPCGFYCGFCLAYKKGICFGCRYQAERRETDGTVDVFCNILVCATEKGLKVCAECPKHPCNKIDMFSKLYIDYLKKVRKSKRPFALEKPMGERRKE